MDGLWGLECVFVVWVGVVGWGVRGERSWASNSSCAGWVSSECAGVDGAV